MPPPMTLATMMAAASSGPSRRSSEDMEELPAASHQLPVAASRTTTGSWKLSAGSSLLCQEVARDGPLAELHPLVAPVLGEDLHGRVDELPVLQHLGARFGASVAEVRS